MLSSITMAGIMCSRILSISSAVSVPLASGTSAAGPLQLDVVPPQDVRVSARQRGDHRTDLPLLAVAIWRLSVKARLAWWTPEVGVGGVLWPAVMGSRFQRWEEGWKRAVLVEPLARPTSVNNVSLPMARHDRAIAKALPLTQASDDSRARLRLQSLSWALLGGLAAALIGLPAGLDSGLRSAGCGFFYGLLAFHLQRVDPDDEHLAAGLVGAVCGIRSLGGPVVVGSLALPVPEIHSLLNRPLAHSVVEAIIDLMRGWLPLWLPLIGSALLLRGAQRLLPALRP